jgi:transposase
MGWNGVGKLTEV